MTINKTELSSVEISALRFLSQGPDVMPRTLASEGQMCAVIVFSGLERRGLVSREVGPETITYQLTDVGIEALL